ncbi:MAG: Gfo/Idh/MocA family oxidoreductase [Candidatus Omnitrophota bacterium]
MTNDSLKLAFIGGGIGSIAGIPHYVASSMDAKFDLVAGAFSLDKQINQESADRWGIKRFYDSWRDLIEQEKNNIDAAVVLTPTPIHFDMICALLDKNIPIISEKAVVSTMEDIRKIKEIYNPEEHFLVVTYNYSGYPLIRELKHRISKGELGKIINIRLEMPQESFLRPPISTKYPQVWRLQDKYIPTICLDLGVHLHQMAFFLTGMEPSSLFATMKSFSSYSVVDDVEILLEYDNGASGNFWMSKVAIGHRNGLRVRVYGEKASAEWFQAEPETMLFSYVNGEKKIIERGGDTFVCNEKRYNRMNPGHPAGFIEAFANVYSDIGDALIAFKNKKNYKNQYVFGLEPAEKGLTLFHRAKDSHKQKCWLPI